MQTITLKTSSSKKALPLIMDAIEREKRILMDSITITQQNINSLASKLHVNISHLEKGKVLHTEENEDELIELEGGIGNSKKLAGRNEKLGRCSIMSIREYFDEIRHLIANTPFILSISLHLEERPPFAGTVSPLLRGD